jgi:uncharacterized protein YkwD
MRIIRKLASPVAGLVGLVALVADAYAFDLIDVANLVRSQHCGEESITDQPLEASRELDIAVRGMADGDDMVSAIATAGYRARSSAAVRISSSKGKNDAIAKTLAESFCHHVANPDFVDIGAFRRGKEVWFVFADGAPLPGPDDPGLVDRLLARINELRSEPRACGSQRVPAVPPLELSAVLEEVANGHARDMAANDFLDHTGSDGSRPSDRATRAGYSWKRIAENVAAGQTRPEDVASTWLESPGHCANLMDPRHMDTGIAYAIDASGDRAIYWVQVYAAPK